METIQRKLEAILAKLKPNAAIDLVLITTFISQFLAAIRGCRSPEQAKAQIRKGGAVAYGQALRIVRDEGYKGREARELAWDIKTGGAELTDPELEELIVESRDLPQPAPAPGGFWPMWALLLLPLFASTVAAQETTKFWPIDEVQNRRLDEHDAAIGSHTRAIDGIIERLNRIKWPGDAPSTSPALGIPAKPPVVAKGATATVQETAICPCGGSKTGSCFCLQKGIACGCSANVGSVWSTEAKPATTQQIDQAIAALQRIRNPPKVAVAKTGQYANPATGAAVAKPGAGSVQAVRSMPVFQSMPQFQCSGRQCRRARRGG